jgi:molecular chaperone GrpE
MTDDQQKPTDIDLTQSPAAQPGGGNGTPEAVMPEKTDEEPAPPSLEARIATLETEKAELRERMLRIAADFDNWKKRSRKELADAKDRAKEDVLREFLDIADNLERAAASFAEGKEPDAKSIRDGVELVLRQFRSKLERQQVRPVECLGQAFDPRFHEAISQMATDEAKPGTVFREYQKGYLVGERLLRPAMVVVATAPPPPAPTAASDEPATPGKPEGEG